MARTQTIRVRKFVLVMIGLGALVPGGLTLSHAATIRWINPEGGVFSDGANWEGGVAPGAADVGVFDLPGLYPIHFDADASVQGLTVSNGDVTFDLQGHVLTPSVNVRTDAGIGHISGGTVRGTILAHGGLLVVEHSAAIQLYTLYSSAGVDSGAQMTVRGTISDLCSGCALYGSVGTVSGSVLSLEGGGINVRHAYAHGQLVAINGGFNCESGGVDGGVEFSGGALSCESGMGLSGNCHFFGGARVSSRGGYIDAGGTMLIEGAGTTVALRHFTAGVLTVRSGGTLAAVSSLYCDNQQFMGTTRLVVGADGGCTAWWYPGSATELRLEQGSTGPCRIDGVTTRLEIVLDAARNPAFNPREIAPSLNSAVGGAISIEVLNPNILRVGDEVVLLTCAAPVAGSYISVETPDLGGGRAIAVVIDSPGYPSPSRVLARVVPGGSPCWGADFDGDGDVGTDADIGAFFACLAGNCCATCASADFDGDGDVATDADIEAFFRVLAGGVC